MKNILGIIGLILCFYLYCFDNKSEMTVDLTFENIEALTTSESSEDNILKCWKTTTTFSGDHGLTHVTYCGGCIAVTARGWYDESTCK